MILIDMSAIKAGGGCQLALNFINEISTGTQKVQDKLVFLLPDSGPLSDDLDNRFKNLFFITSPSTNPIKRLIFEKRHLKKIIQKHSIKTIYTFFGAGLPSFKNVFSITSVAYPIICYDESPFWNFLFSKKRIRQNLINDLRLKRLKKADLIVAETTVMKKRLAKSIGISSDKIIVMPPSPSEFVSNNIRKYRFNRNETKFLLLSGSSLHKNLWRLPELIKELSKKTENIKFVLSIKEEDFLNSLSIVNTKHDLASIYNEYKNYFEFRGSIKPDHIQEVYSECDFLLSLSDLESFSNNYMEAWKVGIPLIVSNRDFAKNICRDSALYIEPHSPEQAATLIYNHISNNDLVNGMIKNGKDYLNTLPDNKRRVAQIIELVSNPNPNERGN